MHVLWLMARHGSGRMIWPSKDGGKDRVTVSVTYSVSSLHSECLKENLVKGSQPYYLSSAGMDVLSH